MSSRKKYSFLLSLFLILSIFTVGFFLRAQETLSGNFLFLLDSGRDMMDVKQIVFDHKLTLIGPYTSLGGVFQGPLYYYLLAIPTFIFQGNPWGSILFMLIISMSVMVVVFHFMKKYFGLTTAIITVALFAVSPEAIAAATYFWNPHPMWIILSFYIFILYGAINKNKLMLIALWPIVAISFHFEMAFGVFLLIATFVYLLIFQRFLFKEKFFWMSAAVSLVFFIPQILFDFRHDFLMSRSILEILNGNNKGLISSSDQSGFLVTMTNNFNVLKNNLLTSFVSQKEFAIFPKLLLAICVGVFIYIFRSGGFSKPEKKFMHAVFSIAIIIVLLCLLYPFPLRYWFLTGFQTFYLVLAGLLLGKLFKFSFGKIIISIIAIIFLIYAVGRLNVLYFNPPDDGGVSKIKGKIDAIDYIYKDAKNNKFGVMIFNPPVLTDAYDYLFWWYGNKKYGFVPASEKKGIVYLLMEPDPGNPSSYNGWLETVIKNGTVLETKTLPSGIIIEKRDFDDHLQ